MSTSPRRTVSASDSSCCAPDCCSNEGATPTRTADATTMSPEELRHLVRDKYGDIARGRTEGCGCAAVDMQALGYSSDQAAGVPTGADLGLGCGNPLQHAEVKVGETVLDLGSGAGLDAFLAAREVGTTGTVIGVDMTPDMLDRARSNAERIGADNVEFRLGEIESLPVPDDHVDVIISNCVINLSPDKPRVFSEALRVLRPGGRLVVSDLVLRTELPDDIASSVTAYVGCVAGASRRDEYLRLVREAGFERVEVLEEKRYAGTENDAEDDAGVRRALDWSGTNVVSMKLRAWKPRLSRQAP